MPLMIKLNRNVVRVYLCLDNGHFITVFTTTLSVTALFRILPPKKVIHYCINVDPESRTLNKKALKND